MIGICRTRRVRTRGHARLMGFSECRDENGGGWVGETMDFILRLKREEQDRC